MVPDATTGDHLMPKNNDAALAAFIARKAEIDAALDRLRAASNDHFFASHWYPNDATCFFAAGQSTKFQFNEQRGRK